MLNIFSGNSDSDEKTCWQYNRQHWKGHCGQQLDLFPILTPLLLVVVTRGYFARGGSVQEVCGVLIGMVQDRPAQSPLFIANLLWGAFRYPQRHWLSQKSYQVLHTLRRLSLPDCWQWTHRTFQCHFFWRNSYFVLSMCLDFHAYPRTENRGEKVKINKNFNATDDRRLAADKARPLSIEFSASFTQCIVGKTTDFSDLKTKKPSSYSGANWQVVHANRKLDLSAV